MFIFNATSGKEPSYIYVASKPYTTLVEDTLSSGLSLLNIEHALMSGVSSDDIQYSAAILDSSVVTYGTFVATVNEEVDAVSYSAAILDGSVLTYGTFAVTVNEEVDAVSYSAAILDGGVVTYEAISLTVAEDLISYGAVILNGSVS